MRKKKNEEAMKFMTPHFDPYFLNRNKLPSVRPGVVVKL